MIVTRWLPFSTVNDIKLFRVYRSIIGFTAKLGVNVAGKTLILKVNTQTVQTITFTNDPLYDLNTQVVGGRAYENFEQDGFIFRSDIRESPGYVEIVGGTALTDLQIGLPRLIEEKSEDELIAEVLADGRPPATFYEYRDNDGTLLDFYAISAVDIFDSETAKTDYYQPIASTKPLCVIEGTLCNIEGARLTDEAVCYSVAENSVFVDNQSAVSLSELVVYTSHNGVFSFAVIQGLEVRVKIPAIGFDSVVCVPAENFKFLNELILTDDYKFKSLILC